jgi:prenyltransferase beta subunit
VLEILKHPYGGFVDFNPATPSPYATYYNLKTLNLPCFNQKIPHRARTVEWLEHLTERRSSTNGTEDVELDDLYFGTKSLKLLNETISQSKADEIIETVTDHTSLATQEGTTADSAQYDLKTVCWGLDIHNTLNASIRPNAELESWLTELWRAWKSSELSEHMSDIFHNYRSLRFIGYNRDEILNIYDPRDEITRIVNTPKNWSAGEEFDLLNIGRTRDLLTKMEIDETLPDSVVQSIVTSQNQDGGFSLLADPISDCRGTYIVRNLLSQRREIGTVDDKAVLNFVLYNAVSQGGFSLHYRQDPGFNQTFAIHWLLSNTPKEYDTAADREYTIPDELYTEEPLDPNKLYKILTIHERTGDSPPTVDVDAFISTYLNTAPSLNVPEKNLLKNVYYSLLLDRDFTSESRYRDSSDESVISSVLNTRNEDGGFVEGEPFRALETFHAVYSLQYLGYQLSDRDQLINWLRAHRNEDGGFGEQIENDSASDIFSTYFSARTLLLLDAGINENQSIQSWLDDICHINGGYSRGSQYDNPSIRYTVLAIDLKHRLGELTERNGDGT